jgi:D-alanyl-D-alanine carboxypeptidase
MYRVTVGASQGRRGKFTLLLAALVAFATLAATADPAEAARWRKKRAASHAPAASIVSNPQYAAIVVDANTGDILHSANPDSLRHPASLTKIMTLYLLFERLESGKIKLSTPLDVSAHASAQAPSKLGLRPGQTIAVEDAIKALVTKSANDIAVVVAEALAGSEEEFARQMTRKARALRMTKTVYKNASGLPDSDQVTTARDQALLGLAIQDRFPAYYKYFSTRSFSFRGRSMANHNRLLGRVSGMDGIKTGYTRASGFNLVTSVRRGNRHIVATVLGGRSAAQRDARMRDLIEARIVEASVRRTTPRVTEIAAAEPAKPARVAAATPPAAPKVETKADVRAQAQTDARAAPRSEPAAAPRVETVPAKAEPAPAAPVAGSTEPIRPRLVKTLTMRPGAVQVAPVAPLSLLSPEPITQQSTHQTANEAPAAASAPSDTPPPPPPGARPGVLGVLPAKDMARATAVPAESPAKPLATAETTSSSRAPSRPGATPARETRPRSGWIIQVGAFPDEDEARQKIANAKSKAARLLNDADSFTEPVTKGDKTLYRARFAGFKQHQAEAACRYLKQNDFACMTIRN